YAPNLAVEPWNAAAVQRVRAVVGDELDLLAADGESRTSDAPGIAADDRAEAIILVVRFIVGEAAEPKRDIRFAPSTVGHVALGDDPAVIDEMELRAARVAKHIFADLLPVL